MLWLLALTVAAPAKGGPEVDPKIEKAVMAQAPAIDACVSAHTKLHPDARGKVTVSAEFQADGTMVSTNATSQLPASGPLSQCLKLVARRFQMPALNQPRSSMVLEVAVYAGARFSLRPPPEPKDDSKERRPLGAFTFQPGVLGYPGWETSTGAPPPDESSPTGQAPEQESSPTGQPAEPEDPLER